MIFGSPSHPERLVYRPRPTQRSNGPSCLAFGPIVALQVDSRLPADDQGCAPATGRIAVAVKRSRLCVLGSDAQNRLRGPGQGSAVKPGSRSADWVRFVQSSLMLWVSAEFFLKRECMHCAQSDP